MSIDSGEMFGSCDRKTFFCEGMHTMAGVVGVAAGVIAPERAAAAAAKKQDVVSACDQH